jgi:hypothetical protein
VQDLNAEGAGLDSPMSRPITPRKPDSCTAWVTTTHSAITYP